MRLGIAKLEKLRFSFVSALTFHYLCSTNYKLRTVMETLEKIFAAKLLKVKAIKLQPTNAASDFMPCATSATHTTPYNKIERKKGSHPSYKLWFNPLR